jgi:hypothetical protein
MKKQIYPFFILLFFVPSLLQGQFVTKQAGFRFGYRSGIFYQVSQEAGTAEVGFNTLLSFKESGIQVTGLRIFYESSLDNISPNLLFSWGYGGHLGFSYSDHVRFMGEDYYYTNERFMPLFGADGWLALEYRIEDIPLTVSLNYKPFIELTIPAFVRVVPADFAFSIAYIF